MGRTFDAVFQGGGVKSICLNAAVQELEARGHRFGRLVGSSAGAITAALLAVGFTGEQLVALSTARGDDDLPVFYDYIREPNEERMVGVRATRVFSQSRKPLIGLRSDLSLRNLNTVLPALRAVYDVLEHGGLYTGNGFVAWMVDAMEQHEPGLSSITFQQLHQRNGAHVTIMATDLTRRRPAVLNHITAPNCPLIAAVRMSMGIPMFFDEVLWHSSFGRYMGKNVDGHVMVDGGVVSTFPIAFVLPQQGPVVARYMGPVTAHAQPLGLMLNDDLVAPDVPPAPATPMFSGDGLAAGFGRRVEALFDTMLTGMDHVLSDTIAGSVIHLPTGTYSPLEFDMRQDRVLALLDGARRAVAQYLEG